MTDYRSRQDVQPGPPPAPSRGEAFRYWLKLGFISFGGAAGQIGMMHEDLVERRRWVSEKRFLHALNYAMVLPGPEAQQLATYLGWLLHGTLGGLMAGLLFILPSLFLIAGLSWVYLAFGDVPAVEAVFYGIKPAVVAIIAYAGWRIGGRVLNNGLLWLMAIAPSWPSSRSTSRFPTSSLRQESSAGWAAASGRNASRMADLTGPAMLNRVARQW